MTNSNPFDRPGLGQGSAGNPIMQSLHMMSKAWQQFAQVQNAASPVFAVPTALDANELDKRIQELKSIENWLTMNLTMLSGTIQGLEIQRASINTLKTFVDTMQNQSSERSFDEIFGLSKKPADKGTAGKSTTDKAGKQDKAASEKPGDQPFAAESVNQAAQAWWDMLQGQFSQLAQTVTQASQASTTQAGSAPKSAHKEPSPVKTPPGPEPDEPADPQEPVKPTTRKRAAAKRRTTSRSTA